MPQLFQRSDGLLRKAAFDAKPAREVRVGRERIWAAERRDARCLDRLLDAQAPLGGIEEHLQHGRALHVAAGCPPRHRELPVAQRERRVRRQARALAGLDEKWMVGLEASLRATRRGREAES